MAIRFKNLSVRRDELTLLKVSVAEWEVPLLHLVHGEGMVQELEGEPWSDAAQPDVQDEYRRLEAKYKTPPEEDGRPGQKAVGLVYGPFGASPMLRQAIQAATFDRKVDLLGVEALRETAKSASAAAASANAALASAEAAAVKDADEETPAPKKRAAKAPAATSLL